MTKNNTNENSAEKILLNETNSDSKKSTQTHSTETLSQDQTEITQKKKKVKFLLLLLALLGAGIVIFFRYGQILIQELPSINKISKKNTTQESISNANSASSSSNTFYQHTAESSAENTIEKTTEQKDIESQQSSSTFRTPSNPPDTLSSFTESRTQFSTHQKYLTLITHQLNQIKYFPNFSELFIKELLLNLYHLEQHLYSDTSTELKKYIDHFSNYSKTKHELLHDIYQAIDQKETELKQLYLIANKTPDWAKKIENFILIQKNNSSLSSADYKQSIKNTESSLFYLRSTFLAIHNDQVAIAKKGWSQIQTQGTELSTKTFNQLTDFPLTHLIEFAHQSVNFATEQAPISHE